MGGHRAFGAGDDLVDGPVDLAAVRADDALLDAIAGGAVAGGVGSHEDVFGRPGQDDDHLAAILAAWKADIEADPMPELVSLDEASEAVEAGHAARDRRASRARRRMPFAVAAAAVAVALAGLTVAVHSAQPGDTMFGLTKVFFSAAGGQRAEGAGGPRRRSSRPTTPIRRGDPATAQSLLQSAAGQIQAAQPEDQPALQQQREDALKSLAPQAPTESASPSTEPSASSGTEAPRAVAGAGSAHEAQAEAAAPGRRPSARLSAGPDPAEPSPGTGSPDTTGTGSCEPTPPPPTGPRRPAN